MNQTARISLKKQYSITQQVREDAAWVIQRAKHIHINHKILSAYTHRLVMESPLVVTLDADNHFIAPADPALTAAYVILLDSINFGSGAFHIAQRDGINLEYHVVAQGLKQAFVKGIFNADAQSWAVADAALCHRIFDIPHDAHPALGLLMQQFAAHVRKTADLLVRDFDDVSSLIKNYRGGGLQLLETISQWPHFSDVTHYDGHTVAIMKRAQILLADLELALAPSNAPWFDGLSQLTCFADNMVPHVLRADGILEYSSELAHKVDAGEFIAAGSVYETELRCAAIHTVELMRAHTNAQLTAVNLDHMLWHRGYLPNFTQLKPHRTLSTCY